jgi:hypothetical protein
MGFYLFAGAKSKEPLKNMISFSKIVFILPFQGEKGWIVFYPARWAGLSYFGLTGRNKMDSRFPPTRGQALRE